MSHTRSGKTGGGDSVKRGGGSGTGGRIVKFRGKKFEIGKGFIGGTSGGGTSGGAQPSKTTTPTSTEIRLQASLLPKFRKLSVQQLPPEVIRGTVEEERRRTRERDRARKPKESFITRLERFAIEAPENIQLRARRFQERFDPTLPKSERLVPVSPLVSLLDRRSRPGLPATPEEIRASESFVSQFQPVIREEKRLIREFELKAERTIVTTEAEATRATKRLQAEFDKRRKAEIEPKFKIAEKKFGERILPFQEKQAFKQAFFSVATVAPAAAGLAVAIVRPKKTIKETKELFKAAPSVGFAGIAGGIVGGAIIAPILPKIPRKITRIDVAAISREAITGGRKTRFGIASGEIGTKFLFFKEKTTPFIARTKITIKKGDTRAARISGVADVFSLKKPLGRFRKVKEEKVKFSGILERDPDRPIIKPERFTRIVFRQEKKPRKGKLPEPILTGEFKTLESIKKPEVLKVERAAGITTETTIPLEAKVFATRSRLFTGFKKKPIFKGRGSLFEFEIPRRLTTSIFKISTGTKRRAAFKQLPPEPTLTPIQFAKPKSITGVVRRPREFGFPEQVPEAPPILEGFRVGEQMFRGQIAQRLAPSVRVRPLVSTRFAERQRFGEGQKTTFKLKVLQKQIQTQAQAQPQPLASKLRFGLNSKQATSPKVLFAQITTPAFKTKIKQATRLAPKLAPPRTPRKVTVPPRILFPFLPAIRKPRIFTARTGQRVGVTRTRFVPSLTAISLGLRRKTKRKKGQVFTGLELRRLDPLPILKRRRRR